jgi:glycosyltransferase involved in cell wall biosynthesis
MKIFISDKKLSGGPSVFKELLKSSLKNKGYHLVLDSSEKVDIELGFISFKSKNAKKRILRLDGVYYQSHQVSMNSEIKDNIKKADAIIYQSEFSKSMVKKMVLDARVPECVIYNGTDLNKIKSASPLKKYGKTQFVMCADWRNTKRPMSAVRGFCKWIKDNKIKDTKLVVMGDFGKYKNEISSDYKNSIILLGDVKNSLIFPVLKSSDFMMHLCFIDSCPNSVVEGISCGLPVLCTNLGGTREIVGDYGHVINCDSFNFSPTEKITDNISPDIVSNGISALCSKNYNNQNSKNLDINMVVDKYIKFMESL